MQSVSSAATDPTQESPAEPLPPAPWTHAATGFVLTASVLLVLHLFV